MNKLLTLLLTGIFASTLSIGAMAADATPAKEAAAAATAPASNAKAPVKAMHRSHKKHVNQKLK